MELTHRGASPYASGWPLIHVQPGGEVRVPCALAPPSPTSNHANCVNSRGREQTGSMYAPPDAVRAPGVIRSSASTSRPTRHSTVQIYIGGATRLRGWSPPLTLAPLPLYERSVANTSRRDGYKTALYINEAMPKRGFLYCNKPPGAVRAPGPDIPMNIKLKLIDVFGRLERSLATKSLLVYRRSWRG